jgi:hypothetical protein
LSIPKQTEIQLKIEEKLNKECDRKKSPSPEHGADKSTRGPIIAKTDFTLQQQMMGLGKCKDLDEWLMGSGESAVTADSKGVPNLKFGARHLQN